MTSITKHHALHRHCIYKLKALALRNSAPNCPRARSLPSAESHSHLEIPVQKGLFFTLDRVSPSVGDDWTHRPLSHVAWHATCHLETNIRKYMKPFTEMVWRVAWDSEIRFVRYSSNGRWQVTCDSAFLPRYHVVRVMPLLSGSQDGIIGG